MSSPSPAPSAATTIDLNRELRRLGLVHTAEQLDDLIARTTRARTAPRVMLEQIVRAELEDRSRRSLERRLKHARLGRFKPMADWEWDWPKTIDRRAVERVLSLDFLGRGENVLVVGAQGLGKSMIAKNVAHQARQHVGPALVALDRGLGPRVSPGSACGRSRPLRRPRPAAPAPSPTPSPSTPPRGCTGRRSRASRADNP